MTERPVFRPSSVDAFIPEVPRVRASQPDGSHPFPHLSGDGEARMVDVSAKEVTARSASAKGVVLLSKECLDALADAALPKGDALAVARIAGVMGAKKTSDLIPLCHPLPITRVAVDFELDEANSEVRCIAQVETFGRTGVEMEALTAVQVGLLTVYDMCKAADRGMVMGAIRVLGKRGGQSGDWTADPA